jgi:hypothetical protein
MREHPATQGPNELEQPDQQVGPLIMGAGRVSSVGALSVARDP